MKLLTQKGFAPIIYVIIIAVVLIASGLAIKNFKTFGQTEPNRESSNSAIASVSASPKTNPTIVKPKTNLSSSPTIKPTIMSVVSSTPTQTPSVDNSCSYTLSGPTGAVRVDIKPQSNQVVGDQIIELQAKSGCKVLDGRSTDKQTQIARAGGNGYSTLNSSNYSTVPAGHYSVRIQYKGQWTGYKDVDVSPTQQSIVEFIVEGGAPTATSTPTPKPKPICSVTIMPSNSGTAPFSASVCIGNNSNPYQAVQQEFVDYDGNGSWDYQGAQYGCHSYTFSSPGNYTAKGKITGASGETSDICEASITVN